MNHHIIFLTVFLSTYLSARIFLSYQSRQVALESELESKMESMDSCGCPPSDGSFSRASDPHCPYIRRKEVFQFLIYEYFLSSFLLKFCFSVLHLFCSLLSFFSERSPFHFLFVLLSDCMSLIVFLKMGKCLPGSFTMMLATISSADECTDKIIEFINAHIPGARELVTFLSCTRNYLYFQTFYFYGQYTLNGYTAFNILRFFKILYTCVVF